MSINFLPLHDRIILTPVERPKMQNGIIMPENDSSPWCYGMIEAIGPGLTNQTGSIMPTKSKVGDVVLYYKCDATPLEIDGVSYHCLRETNVIGIYKKEETND